MSHLIFIFIIIQLLRQFKNGVSLFWDPFSLFYFKSVGLDITSVLLNPYKMAATYPFWDFFLSKNHINARFPRDTLWIERLFSISTNFTLELKTWLNRILSIYILIYMIYLRSCSNLLIGINPRFLPPERWIHTFYPSSIMYYIHYNLTKKDSCENRTDVGSRAPSFIEKMADIRIKIHTGSCPSSRTLLSTTAFQTKFYHNKKFL